LRNLPQVAQEAILQAKISASDLTAVAATRGPGLPAALMAGFTAAQTMAFALGVRFIAIHHHEAHLYSPWIEGDPPASMIDKFEPNVSLVVSGGHTMLVYLPHEGSHEVLGSTLDDAAGEAFDKTAKMLGLPYPGGPRLDKLAEEGDPSYVDFPRSLLDSDSDDFSFSGLKTSVRYYLQRNPGRASSPSDLRKPLCQHS
jgi:N6-L-threonylcarbamoyladenine synthase